MEYRHPSFPACTVSSNAWDLLGATTPPAGIYGNVWGFSQTHLPFIIEGHSLQLIILPPVEHDAEAPPLSVLAAFDL